MIRACGKELEMKPYKPYIENKVLLAVLIGFFVVAIGIWVVHTVTSGISFFHIIARNNNDTPPEKIPPDVVLGDFSISDWFLYEIKREQFIQKHADQARADASRKFDKIHINKIDPNNFMYNIILSRLENRKESPSLLTD